MDSTDPLEPSPDTPMTPAVGCQCQGDSLSPPTAEQKISEDKPAEQKPVEIKTENNKIEVMFRPTGSAQNLKKSKWIVSRERPFGWIAEFLKKMLNMEPSQSIFLYVKQSFAPAADTEVGSVYDCFGNDGRLVLHYCATEAWG